jgi:hypothetical protein
MGVSAYRCQGTRIGVWAYGRWGGSCASRKSKEVDAIGATRRHAHPPIPVPGPVAQEVASFGFGITVIEPGGARQEFRYDGARVAKLMFIYDQTLADSLLRMLDPKNRLAPGNGDRLAARIIESVDLEPAAWRLVLGSQTLEGILTTLSKRIATFEAQTERPASRNFPRGMTSTPFSYPRRPPVEAIIQ